MSSIPLSNEKISFTASLQEGWSGGQGSGDKSRAVKPDFPGLAREQKVLTTDEALSKPLYLHPIETVNKTLKNQGPTTRGTMNDSHVVDNFRVSANYIQNGSSEEESFFQDREAKKEGSNNNWFVADSVKWPTAGTVSFYAYAPYNYNNVSSLKWMGVDDVTQNKTIHYEVPTKVEDQPDFIVANSEGKSFTSSSANTPVDLQFSHALTAITFSVSDDMIPGTVKSIKVSGVYGEGDYDLSTGIWKYGATSTYVIELKDAPVQAGVITPLTDKTSALMMIPQDFGPDAKAKVSMVFNDGAKDKTVSFSLNGTSWKAGNHITYVLSSSKITTLKMGDLTYPSGWNSVNDVATNKIRKAYDDPNTSAGLFVVNDENKVIAANVQLTYDGNSWSLPADSKLKFSPKYNYFVYYPYQANLAGLPAVNKTKTCDVSSSTKFFADAIANWKIATDQSTPDKMNACDLQIGKASLDEDGCRVNFTMEHAMGLAEIVLGEKKVDHIYKTQTFGKAGVYTWGDKKAVYASNNIKGYKPFNIANHKYVTIVRPKDLPGAVPTTLDTEKSDVNGWKKPLSFSPSGNQVQTLVAENKQASVETDYPIGLGYIFYNDGSISKDLTGQTITSDHCPIGIIVYLAENNDGNDKWAETNTAGSGIGGHGLVMCLKNIGSTGSTDDGKKLRWSAWNNSDVDVKNIPNVTSKPDIVNSKNQTSGSGYTMTAELIKIDSEAAIAAKNYNTLPAPSSNCTGWFLPTAGQYYAAMSQLGGGMSSDWEMDKFFSNMKDVTTKINDNLKKVGDDSKYTEFFQGHDTWAWTSSEYSNNNGVGIDSGVDNIKVSGSVRFSASRDKVGMNPVRLFLAF